MMTLALRRSSAWITAAVLLVLAGALAGSAQAPAGTSALPAGTLAPSDTQRATARRVGRILEEARFAPEHAPLLRAMAVFTLFSVASAGSFYGELRERAWRLAAHGATLAVLAMALWMYWPR